MSIHAAQKQLYSLIGKALSGEEVIITLNENSYVQLVPYNDESDVKQLFGCMKGEIDYVEGWDAPLEGDMLQIFYKK
ncbi:type II toxin-antitoxin system Phd/YefM family antitoxin [Halomonas sp. QHL1]|uniref:type II toxin-antitoxin system Phd/YefM family antitoxin n=1 Tax=Halomonas sp. QHL1 TaxID=1123773 RepID=UPI001114D1E9|nr:hypothetical protein [Halomonas sp. QHL1]